MPTLETTAPPPGNVGDGRGRGRAASRLAAALDWAAALPQSAQTSRQVLYQTRARVPFAPDIAASIQRDPGLALAVVRAANVGRDATERVSGVLEAVDVLPLEGVVAIATTHPAYDMLSPATAELERFRRHAVATRFTATLVAKAARFRPATGLDLAALLHDIGKLALMSRYGAEYDAGADRGSPDERVHRELRKFGMDHAVVGSVLIRRLGLGPEIASAIERHHERDATEAALVIGVANAMTHFVAGDPVDARDMAEAAAKLGLEGGAFRELVHELPYAATSERIASSSPLSGRELDALEGLAAGKLYAEIAQDLGLSVSTIRSHISNLYRKLGVSDRAQAVLMARDRGWI